MKATAADAVAFLRVWARDQSSERGKPAAAIATLIDHITQLEQAVTLMEGGVQSASRNRPTFAVLTDTRKK